VLGELGRLALRTGKRARAETAIGRAGLSLLSAAVELAAASLGPLRPGADPLAGRDVLVVGAGSMSGLATATAARSGAASITVANRTRKHAERLAASVSTVTTTVTGLADLPAAIAAADVVISCTGATGQVITGDMVSAALAAREPGGALVIMDLAMPRDVEPAVADLPGVVLIGMDQLSEHAGAVRDDDVAAVRTILEAELAAYQSAMDAARVAPTVVALRAKAAGVVDAELARLAGRLSADDLSGHALDEIAQTVRRVVDKLLHAPTVRVKELAGSPGGEEYAAALRVLFDLDPRAVEAVTRAAPEQEGSR
jgi:glutamyl-tRNA reductase